MQITIKHEEFQPSPILTLIKALQAKDAALFHKLRQLHPSAFWFEWKKVYPEDFPHGGQSPADPSSIVPKA
ncbi:hypothetical protein [Rhizobium sp. NZLR11]|uniref:hypothetical protein n=1 Tax=Rhizobium sp. NZLR11 TaxID=2731098 RepID=UPI001C8368DA|nr:hypothetical protein [Rhizobium sp. NZLR11]MBX5206703.1 hypothetical protein [Rhizobium sp. NZLR11]